MKHCYLITLIITSFIWTNEALAQDSVARPTWRYDTEYEMPDPSKDSWWKGFDDALLDSIVGVAVGANYDVKMAARRMEISRLQMMQARSAYWPTVNVTAGWTKQRSSSYATSNVAMTSESVDFFHLGAQANWEIDVFGKIGSNVKAQRAAVGVSRAEYASVVLSLCAEIANDYISLRAAQNQLAVAEALLKAEGEVLHIAEVRHDVALASGLDVSQAKTVYYATKATIPSLQTTIAQTINAITTLMGEDGAAWRDKLSYAGKIPFFSMPFDKSVTGEMLRRRPDVIAAERQIAEYAALAGVAKKDFLPSLSLSATAGVEAHSLSDLFRRKAFTFTVAPTLSWTAFSGFSRKYALASAKEQMEEGIENYRMVLLSASAEVDNAVIAYRNAVQRTAMLSQVLAEAVKSLDFSVDLYKQGLSTFLNVMDAQINVLNYNNQVIAEKAAAQQAVIDLYKALGGGWQE